jgi:all-trans-retinol dehydrogenase (NAD+)
MPKSILPREGLTLEAAFAPLRLTILQPLLTGPLLLAAYQFPTSILSKWPFPENLQLLLHSTRMRTILSLLLVIGLLRKIHKIMNKLVSNNFTTDKTWDWTKEIVLITGGSSGMGAVMVRMFAERGIKVVILDIVAPLEALNSCTCPLTLRFDFIGFLKL